MTDEPPTLRRVLDVRLDRRVEHLDKDVRALTRRVIGRDGNAA